MILDKIINFIEILPTFLRHFSSSFRSEGCCGRCNKIKTVRQLTDYIEIDKIADDGQSGDLAFVNSWGNGIKANKSLILLSNYFISFIKLNLA